MSFLEQYLSSVFAILANTISLEGQSKIGQSMLDGVLYHPSKGLLRAINSLFISFYLVPTFI